MSRATIILGCVLGYMALCLLIGIWAMRRTKSTRDFFIAGRDLGVMVTGLAVFSSMMSGFGFVGGPGLVYQMGTSSLWIVAGAPIGYCFSFFLLGKRLRLLGELCNSVSLPDVVAVRYNSEACRLLTALSILLGVLGYLGAQILAMATVLQDVVSSHPQLGAISLELAMSVACAVLVFYCVTGGMIASVYTDLVQGLMMIVAAILIFVTAIHSFHGGMTGISQAIESDNPEAMLPWGTLGIVGCVTWFFMFSLGQAGQPHIVTKYMMYRRISDARYILVFAVVAYGLASLLWISIGLAMRAHVLTGGHPPLPGSDHAAAQFLQQYAHPVLAGLVFAGLFSAIMSTADAFLNVGAAAVVHDIPRALTGKPLKRELMWARLATATIAVVASGFALYLNDLVALLGSFGWGTFAAALVPTVAIGFNWKRATAPAAITAIVASLVINFSVEVFGIKLPHGFHVGALAMLVSLLLFFLISYCSKPPRIDPEIEAVMEL
ncbi:MAG: sodium/proline symporter [Planctomycetota bacterium]